jgi:hypothetical protein
VGIQGFVENVQALLGTKATNRKVTEMVVNHALREQAARYNTVSGAGSSDLSLDNRHSGDDLLLESTS